MTPYALQTNKHDPDTGGFRGNLQLCKGWKARSVSLGRSLQRGMQVCCSLEMDVHPGALGVLRAMKRLTQTAWAANSTDPSQASFHHIHGTHLAI